MFTPRLEERCLYDRIVQEWLVSTHVEVDEQRRPQPSNAHEPQLETEELEAGPSTTLLEKLAMQVDKLEEDMAKVLENQQYIIHLLTQRN